MRRPGLAGLVVFGLLALLAPATAAARDRDRDGLPDRWEKRHGLSTTTASASADPDHVWNVTLNPHSNTTFKTQTLSRNVAIKATVKIGARVMRQSVADNLGAIWRRVNCRS